MFFVEDMQYQKAAIQEMERAMLPVVPMKPVHDKRSRLQVVAPSTNNPDLEDEGVGEKVAGESKTACC